VLIFQSTLIFLRSTSSVSK